MRKILVDISSHGFGHLAQTAPVINHLKLLNPQIEVIVRTNYASTLVKSFFDFDIDCDDFPFEPTLEMHGPVSVNLEKSDHLICKFFNNWNDNISYRRGLLQVIRPDLLISNIPYGSLEAAKELEIPSIALCSYNWFETQKFFNLGSETIRSQTMQAYSDAKVFIQPQPHMPMPYLYNTHSVGPIARQGVNKQYQLRQRFNISTHIPIILVTLGGIPGDRKISLPLDNRYFWLIDERLPIHHPYSIRTSDCDMNFIDLLASCDLVVTKEGYGAVVEAACNGKKILMLSRINWLETPFFIEWAESNTCCQILPIDHTAEQFEAGLQALLAEEQPSIIKPTGISEAANIISDFY